MRQSFDYQRLRVDNGDPFHPGDSVVKRIVVRHDAATPIGRGRCHRNRQGVELRCDSTNGGSTRCKIGCNRLRSTGLPTTCSVVCPDRYAIRATID